MDRAERDRVERIARRAAQEVLDATTRDGGKVTPAAIARAISEAVAEVMADHDNRSNRMF